MSITQGVLAQFLEPVVNDKPDRIIGKGKTGVPRKNLSEQRREPSTN